MENLVDGVMLVDIHGAVLYMNRMANQICQTLMGQTLISEKSRVSPPNSPLPEAVWHTCQALVEADRGDAVARISSEAEIQSYRVRVQRFQLQRLESPCFMVRFEDQQQSLCHRILAEVQQYGLTQREAEVWRLKRENLSRQEIANQLFISVDTVKKHLCNIQLKRQLQGETPLSH
jgi:DNA-binding CsgD family transcriptional regulator